jgi:hypothetical protein
LAVKTVNWFVPFSTKPTSCPLAVPPPSRATLGVPLSQLRLAKLSQWSANAEPTKAHVSINKKRTRLSRVRRGGEGIVIILALEICILSAKQPVDSSYTGWPVTPYRRGIWGIREKTDEPSSQSTDEKRETAFT